MSGSGGPGGGGGGGAGAGAGAVTGTSALAAATTSSKAKPGVVSLTPSLANYYTERLVEHVQGWPSDTVEKQVRLHTRVAPNSTFGSIELCATNQFTEL